MISTAQPDEGLNKESIALVVAVAGNGAIGRAGRLPWHIPEDLAWFKAVTMGKPMIMGRATWDSIGSALPGRDSIVLSRDPYWQAEGAHRAALLTQAIALARTLRPGTEITVIGGVKIFAEALPLADRLYWTEIRGEFDADTFFPPFDRNQWREVSRDERDWGSFVVLERQSDEGESGSSPAGERR